MIVIGIFGRVGRARILRHRGVLEYGASVPPCRHRARRTYTGGVGCREFSRLHAQTRMCTTTIAAGLVRPARDMTTLRCEIGSSW